MKKLLFRDLNRWASDAGIELNQEQDIRPLRESDNCWIITVTNWNLFKINHIALPPDFSAWIPWKRDYQKFRVLDQEGNIHILSSDQTGLDDYKEDFLLDHNRKSDEELFEFSKNLRQHWCLDSNNLLDQKVGSVSNRTPRSMVHISILFTALFLMHFLSWIHRQCWKEGAFCIMGFIFYLVNMLVVRPNLTCRKMSMEEMAERAVVYKLLMTSDTYRDKKNLALSYCQTMRAFSWMKSEENIRVSNSIARYYRMLMNIEREVEKDSKDSILHRVKLLKISLSRVIPGNNNPLIMDSRLLQLFCREKQDWSLRMYAMVKLWEENIRTTVIQHRGFPDEFFQLKRDFKNRCDRDRVGLDMESKALIKKASTRKTIFVFMNALWITTISSYLSSVLF